MARPEGPRATQFSVLDRLVDLEPGESAEAPVTAAQSVRQLKQAIKRDLEWLLNTRRIREASSDPAAELTQSLYNYGLPDLSGFGLHTPKDHQRLTWTLESTLATFEPRLENVKVTLQPVDAASRQLRFQIEGLLRMDPAPERISFDTLVELTSGVYRVKGEGGA